MAKAAYSHTRKPKTIEVGQRFGRLLAIKYVGRSKDRKHRRWRFKCDCDGKEIVANLDNVTKERGTISCGCARLERIARQGRANATHGMARTKEYRSWRAMIERCENENKDNFELYGGRGIVVSKRWRTDFAAFYADMGPRPSLAHSIDRWPNKNGNYRPGNCRWATAVQQNRNRRNNRMVFFSGQKMTLPEACEIAGLGYALVKGRLREGWTVNRALTAPRRPYGVSSSTA